MAKALDTTSEEYKLGKQIKKYRKQRRLTQDQLADLVCMERANVANYENGLKGEMGFKTLMKFSKALGASVDVLLGEDDDHGESAGDRQGDKEDKLIRMINKMDEKNRETLINVAEGLLLLQKQNI